MEIVRGDGAARGAAGLALALLFAFVSFWIAAMAGTGENDVGLAGSRPLLLVWWAAAAAVGFAGIAVGLRFTGRSARTWWLVTGAAPVAFWVVVTVWPSLTI